MATHSSVIAWRIPGMGSVVGCRLWGHTELDMTEATWQQQQQYIYTMEQYPAIEKNNTICSSMDEPKDYHIK